MHLGQCEFFLLIFLITKRQKTMLSEEIVSACSCKTYNHVARVLQSVAIVVLSFVHTT